MLQASAVTSAAAPRVAVGRCCSRSCCSHYYPHHHFSPRSINPSVSAVSVRYSPTTECPLLSISTLSLPSRLQFLPFSSRSHLSLLRCRKTRPISAVSECSRRIPSFRLIRLNLFNVAYLFLSLSLYCRTNESITKEEIFRSIGRPQTLNLSLSKNAAQTRKSRRIKEMKRSIKRKKPPLYLFLREAQTNCVLKRVSLRSF